MLNFKESVPRQWNKGQMWKKRFHISLYLMWKDVNIPHHDTLHQLPPEVKSAFQLMWKILSVVHEMDLQIIFKWYNDLSLLVSNIRGGQKNQKLNWTITNSSETELKQFSSVQNSLVRLKTVQFSSVTKIQFHLFFGLNALLAPYVYQRSDFGPLTKKMQF